MSSIEEKLKQIQIASQQKFFDSLEARRKGGEKNQTYRIGNPSNETGKYQVFRNDGGLTTNGNKTFNAAPSADGYVRGIEAGNSIAIDRVNIPKKKKLKAIANVSDNIAFRFLLYKQTEAADQYYLNLDGNVSLYIGGDREDPTEIFNTQTYYAEDSGAAAGLRVLNAKLVSTGGGIDDWSLDIVIAKDPQAINPLDGRVTYYKTFDFITIKGSGELQSQSLIFPDPRNSQEVSCYSQFSRSSNGQILVSADKLILAYLSGNGIFQFSATVLAGLGATFGYSFYCNNDTGLVTDLKSVVLPIVSSDAVEAGIRYVDLYISDTNIYQNPVINLIPPLLNNATPAYVSLNQENAIIFKAVVSYAEATSEPTSSPVFEYFSKIGYSYDILYYPDPNQSFYVYFSAESLLDLDSGYRFNYDPIAFKSGKFYSAIKYTSPFDENGTVEILATDFNSSPVVFSQEETSYLGFDPSVFTYIGGALTV